MPLSGALEPPKERISASYRKVNCAAAVDIVDIAATPYSLAVSTIFGGFFTSLHGRRGLLFIVTTRITTYTLVRRLISSWYYGRYSNQRFKVVIDVWCVKDLLFESRSKSGQMYTYHGISIETVHERGTALSDHYTCVGITDDWGPPS